LVLNHTLWFNLGKIRKSPGARASIRSQPPNNIRYFDTQFNNLRRDPTKNLDVSMDKNFRIAERKYFQIRFEAFNVPNRVGFGSPNLSATGASGFGYITSQANTPRHIESAIKLVW
jgi:hypothetical protein